MSMCTGCLLSYPQVLIEADELGFEMCVGRPLQQNSLMELCLFSENTFPFYYDFSMLLPTSI